MAAETISAVNTSLSIGVQSALNIDPSAWQELLPISYGQFGANVETVNQDVIAQGRQREVGVPVGMTVPAGFSLWFTPTGFKDLHEAMLFTTFRMKANYGITAGESFDATGANTYSRASGDFTAGTKPFRVGQLILASNFALATANGLKRITTAAATLLTVSETVGSSTPATNEGDIEVVGFQMGTAELGVDASGDLPFLERLTGSVDFTTFGLVPGEWIRVGGDGAATQFDDSENNGYGRVKSVTATTITFDKYDSDSPTATNMVTDSSGTGKTIQLFFGRVLKNEVSSALYSRKLFQIERQLGDPNPPTGIQQSQYIHNAVMSTARFSFPLKGLSQVEYSFVGTDDELRTPAQGLKSGTRTLAVSSKAFNMSSDVRRRKMALAVQDDAFEATFFAHVTSFDLTINNNVTPLDEIGTFGSFETNVGAFNADANVEAYFTTVAAQSAVRSGVSVTQDFILWKENRGLVMDFPLVTLGNASLNVTLNEPIKVPITMGAAKATLVDPNYTHTLMLVDFQYLPLAAA